MGDRVVGGSVYHLSDGVDAGPIAAARHVVVPLGLTASELWREHLAPLGLDLLADVASQDPASLPAVRQDLAAGSWEPSFGQAPLHRPELLELEA